MVLITKAALGVPNNDKKVNPCRNL